MKNLQQNNKEKENIQQALKRPDSAKYLIPQNNKIEQPKPLINNNINNINQNNNILKQNPQPLLKNVIPTNINNNIYQKPQVIIAQNNVNNNILMRDNKPQPN